MTDHDRGAYTPQTDAPLTFDARQARGGGPAPMTLIVSAVVLLLLIIALLVFYRSGVRGPAQAPQVVGAPVGQTKSPPPADTAAPAPGAGLQIYKSEAPPPAQSAAPTFAPAPEQPQARPAPMTPAPAPVAPVISAPLRPAQTETSPASAAPAPVVSSAPRAPAAATPAPVKSAAPAAPKAKPAAPSLVAPAPAASLGPPPAGEALVQIGAFSSSVTADKGWNDTAAALPGRMAGKTEKVEKATRDGKTFYRTYVGGFASHADAVSFCAALKAAGKSCMVR